MTIISPNRNQRAARVRVLGAVALAVVGIGVAATIASYASTVRLEYRLTVAERNLGKLRAENADLADRLYSTLSAENLKRTALELGLLIEPRPAYLETAPLSLR